MQQERAGVLISSLAVCGFRSGRG